MNDVRDSVESQVNDVRDSVESQVNDIRRSVFFSQSLSGKEMSYNILSYCFVFSYFFIISPTEYLHSKKS